jgi:hypothetical protein
MVIRIQLGRWRVTYSRSRLREKDNSVRTW